MKLARSNPMTLIFGLALLVLYATVAVAQESETSEKEWEDFDSSNFDDNSFNIDNPWMPLKPGTRYVYEGTTVEDEESMPHRVVISVTDLTKVIDGVRSRITWDLDYSDGQLVEAEIAFFAQDNEGNVWRMGEYPEEYEGGEVVDAPCWISGISGSIAGISMKAKPEKRSSSYSQGWGPSVEFTDRGKVDSMGVETTVPAGSFEDVLVIAEYSNDEPNAFQLKYFAQGVGNIRVGWRGEDATQETLELIKYRKLTPEELGKARRAALRLEKRAYQNSEDVYAQTEPAERMVNTKE
jgi:hypothetical protein